MSAIKLYGYPFSANSHRVALCLSLLGIEIEYVTVDLPKGEHLRPPFAELNPRRSVPVLDTGSEVLNESFAILLYVAQAMGGEAGARLWPSDPVEQARVASWMFWTANELHNGIGLARNERAFGVPSAGDYAAARGERALAYLDAHLSTRPFLELGRPTLADVSVYPFVAVAPEAQLPISGYGPIQTWLKRLAALPGFKAMPRFGANR